MQIRTGVLILESTSLAEVCSLLVENMAHIFDEDLPEILDGHVEVEQTDPILADLAGQYSFIEELKGKYILYRDPEDESLIKAHFCRRWVWCYQDGCTRAAKYDKSKAICVGFMNCEQAASRICEHVESSMHPVHKTCRDSKARARETVEAQLQDLMKVEHNLFTLDETESWHQEQKAKSQSQKQGLKRAPEPPQAPPPASASRRVAAKTQPMAQPQQRQVQLQHQLPTPKAPSMPANVALGALGLRSEVQAMAALSSSSSFQQKTNLMRQARHLLRTHG